MSNHIQIMTDAFAKMAADFAKAIDEAILADLVSSFRDMETQPYIPRYRKDWESSYDPKYTKGTGSKAPRMTPPDVSTLPEKRWVQPRFPKDPEESLTFSRDMKEWLTERKTKHQVCEVLIDGQGVMVYLFKKQNDALMFKLTWG